MAQTVAEELVQDHLDPLASSHPQTWDKYFAILTFFVLSSIIQGCSNIFHGMPRRFGFFSRLWSVSFRTAHMLTKCGNTYQLSMKCLKLSLQKMPASGSSFNFGMGC